MEATQAELTFIAKNEVSVAGKDAQKLLKILDALEENDDVQKVHSNADIDEATLAEAGRSGGDRAGNRSRNRRHRLWRGGQR